MAGDREVLLQVFGLADRKGFHVVRSGYTGHICFIGPDGQAIVKDGGSKAFSFGEAMQFLEARPDRSL